MMTSALAVILMTGAGAPVFGSVPDLPAQTFYLGAYTNDRAATETWLGTTLDYTLGFIRNSSFSAMRTDAAAAAAAAPYTRPVFWAIALVPGLTATPVVSLASVAAGSNDADITYIYQQLALAHPTGDIWIRPGWEGNGNFYPWTQGPNLEASYAGAFQKHVTLARAVSPRFKISFCVNLTGIDVGNGHYDPALAYPGDAYVDAIEGDVYFDVGGQPDGSALWGYYTEVADRSLPWLVSFAASHGKPWGVPEWGFNSDSASYRTFPTRMADFLRVNGGFRASFWDSNDNFAGKLSNNQYPNAATDFITKFGAPTITSANSLTADTTGVAQSLTASKAVTWQITGGADANKFTIVGSTLSMPAPTVGTFVVNIRAVDNRGKIATQTFTATVAGAYTFTNAEASAYVARMAVQPSLARKGLIDTFIGDLKTAGVYAKLDALWILAAHDAGAAVLNVKSSSNTAAGVNSPTFTVDRGFTGSGSAYVNLNRAGNAGGNYTTNAAHISCWVLNNMQSNSGAMGGSTASIDPRDASDKFQGLVNSFTNNTSIASTDSRGHWIANRSTNAAQQYYKNGASIGSDTNSANQAPNASNWAVCAANTSFPAAWQVGLASVGGNLTAGEATAFYNAALAYMQGIGAA